MMRARTLSTWLAAVAALAIASGAFAQSASWPSWIEFGSWQDVDESYRAEFANCDKDNIFRGHRLNQRIGRRYYYGCSSDPNRVTMLKRLPAQPELPNGAVAFASKLSVDLDGSWYACNTPGRTDQCPTSLSLRNGAGQAQPVSSDLVPYVAIPASGPSQDLSGEFRSKTGIGQGDFGVVVMENEVIPIIVADGGPFSKLGEGSIELHRRLGQELCKSKDEIGRCTDVRRPLRSISGPLVTIVEPGSRRRDVTAENVAAITKLEGERIWTQVRAHVER